MKTSFIQNNNTVRVYQYSEGIQSNTLTSAVYTIKHCSMSGFYLELTTQEYILPPKLYGSVNSRVDRIARTFDTSTKSVDVMCTGLKGAGKSLLSKALCNKMLGKGIPVIQVQDAFSGSNFESFMEAIGTCVVIFDEFAKTYVKNQSDLLSFFDGTSQNKRLHIITENNEWKIDEFFHDRPGRVYYHFRYDRIDETVVRECCYDRGLPEEITQDIVDETSKILGMSFDILNTIINDWLEFGEPIKDILTILNVPYSTGSSHYHLVSFKNKDMEILTTDMRHTGGYFYVNFTYKDLNDEDSEICNERFSIDDDDITDVEGNVYVYKYYGYELKVLKKANPF